MAKGRTTRSSKKGSTPKKTKGSGKSKSQKSEESLEAAAAAAADITSPNLPSLADLATAASADSMDADQFVDELNLGTKSFDSQFSMGGISLGSAASWKHGDDAFRVGGHGGVGLGGGISVALQNDAELMLSLSRSHDEDNSLSGVLRPLGPAGDDESREGIEDTTRDGSVGVDLPLPNGKNQILSAESRDDFSASDIMRSAPGHPAELRDGPSPLPKGSDAASITSTGSGKSTGAGSYSSRGHPPPPPHMDGSPMRGPPGPPRGASPFGPPHPGYRGGPYSYGGGPYYRGPPPPHGPPPPGYCGGPYGPPPPLSGPPSSSSKSSGTPGSKKGAAPKGKGAKPYGPPYPGYRGHPPGPYGRGPHPPPPHYYGRGPPPPHGPYGYGPRPGPPPPPGSSSASVGSSKSSPAPKNSGTDAPSIDSTPSKDGSIHTSDTKGTAGTPNKDGREADNDCKDGKDKDGGSATKKLQDSPNPRTIATVDSTVSTGTHETISTAGSLRKKRTYDGLSQAGSSDSASVHSSPHRHPHPGYRGYGPYPPPHHHHRHPGAPYPPPPPYHGRGRHSHGPPPPHMPHHRYHGSPGGLEYSPGQGPMDMRQRRRNNSDDASTLSSHSFSGVSFDPIVGKESKEVGDDESMESVSKRQRTNKEPASPGGRSLSSMTRAKLNKMTVEDKSIDEMEGDDKKISLPELDMATSPGNDLIDTAKTPICKNTKIKKEDNDANKDDAFDFSPEHVASSVTKKTPKADNGDKTETGSNIASAFRKSVNAVENINTPALYSKRTDSLSFDFGDMIKDDPLLNSQLKNHAAYTPLPSVGSNLGGKDGVGINPSFSNIGPQLSWSISPNFGDIAEWADSAIKGRKIPPAIQPSLSSDGKDIASSISPMAIGGSTENGEFAPSLSFWQDEDVDAAIGNGSVMKEDKESILMHLSTLSPENINTGPVFIDNTAMPPPPPARTTEERENNKGQHNGHQTPGPHSKAGRGKPGWPMPPPSSAPWAMQSPHPGMPRYPFVSPPSSHGPQGDRVRNLRGRVPHGGPPMHFPPHFMRHHHPQMSPMIGGPPPKPGMWSPPHPAHLRTPPHPMGSPQHMRPPMDLTPSKRRCVPLKPPLPTKFQGDYDKAKATPVPEFTNLVNFPMYVSQKQSRGVPETMRCCVMCGQACPCAASGKVKRPPPNAKLGGAVKKHGHYAVIPAQNKGLCTSCDVNVWVFCQNGLEVKWCKGCKNFRQWATFGDKGLATKCVRCRERQREKYALQKNAKDNAKVKKK